MICVDVLIAGGSVAGSSLGYQLRKAGVSTCVVDKAGFPRKKLCAGLLTRKTLELIGALYGDVPFPYEVRTSKLRFFYGSDPLSDIAADSGFVLVERADFDDFLREQYVRSGGAFLERTAVREIRASENTAVLSSGEEVRYKVLVGADGANSRVRKQVDKTYRPNAVCLEFESPSADVGDEIGVYFAVTPSGYGWCFPKKDRYTVGVVGAAGAGKELKKTLAAFSESIGRTEGLDTATGALLPFGAYVKAPCRGNILLVGDAAGFADPITGEGIYFAFLSATLASQAILEHLRGGADLRDAYLPRVKRIQRTIDDANRFNRTFFSEFAKPFFLRLVRGKTHILKFFCENVLSQYNLTYMGFAIRYMKERRARRRTERGAAA